MAPVLLEWVPEGDLAHFVSDLVESGTLDLQAIDDSYEDERGYPPYDPRLMVKMLIYGYANAVMRRSPAGPLVQAIRPARNRSRVLPHTTPIRDRRGMPSAGVTTVSYGWSAPRYP